MNFRPPSDGILPLNLDTSIRFSSIGGLKEHIQCLREMIIFPLLYPELFKRFNTRPAKGILFHGPPGTGKTLLARALANECSLVGGRRVSFFMRKGADVMNKFYGESEKNLRMLFQHNMYGIWMKDAAQRRQPSPSNGFLPLKRILQEEELSIRPQSNKKKARKMKPSIIFFDEIDALAPARRPTHDNTHSSVVATLLAEMDGVCDRGDVVVIGATNRPDSMDPAVRRAGRFDRELYFPPPEAEDRRDILKIYTRDWDPCLNNEDLDHIAKITVGYLGSDIKALCSEAVLKAVRRVYPQIYESDCKLLINAQNVEVTTADMLEAIDEMTPTGARYAPQAARPLPPHTVPLLEDQLLEAAELMRRSFPTKNNNCNKKKTKIDLGSAPSVFLVLGECAESLLAPALLAQLEHCLVKELSVSTLHAAHVFSPEQAVISVANILQLFADCRRSGRDCVIFIRDLQSVWRVLDRNHGVEVLMQLWHVESVGYHTILLAAVNGNYHNLPRQLQEVFPTYKDCIYRMRRPTETEVTNFLQPVLTELPLVPPIVYQYVPPPPLPRAPTGPLENEQDMIHRLFREYDNLRVLRCSLKKICRNLSADRRFHVFVTPVDLDVMPDYYNVVKCPMDISTIIAKIDNKQYFCAKEFLDDIDLICSSALLYDKAKPDKTDKKFRHEACALHSEAYAMVADEIPAPLELECQLVARRRRDSGDDSEEPEPGGWSDDFYLSKKDHFGSTNVLFKRSKRSSRKRPYPSTRAYCAKRARYLHTSNRKETNLVINDEVKKDYIIKDGVKGIPKDAYRTTDVFTMTPFNFKGNNPNISCNNGSKENKLKISSCKDDYKGKTPHVSSCKDEFKGNDPNVFSFNNDRKENAPNILFCNSQSKRNEPKISTFKIESKSKKPNISFCDDDSKGNEPKDEGPPKGNQLVINTADLGKILKNNAKPLSLIGLDALIDLHAQLSRTVYRYSHVFDRRNLPQDLNAVVSRYIQHVRK